MLTPLRKSIILVLLILAADQILKFWVKTNMFYGQEIQVFGNWFILHFTENNGMAFGMQFAGEAGKVFLTLFRMAAAVLIAYYIVKLTRKNAPWLQVLCFSLIFAGAVGNIIDSAFYGMLFNDSTYQLATFMPAEGGYSSFLHGRVVDMLYFPVLKGNFPSWFPFWGGEDFIFFRPVFNIADTSITIGVFLLLIFYRRFYKNENVEKSNTSTSPDVSETPNNN